MLGFTFRGETSGEHGICVMGLPGRAIPARRYVEHVIPGRDGVLRTWDGAYEPVQLAVDIYIPAHAAREYGLLEGIAEWLQGRGRLEFSDNPGIEYDATVTLETRLSYWVEGFSDLVGTVTFKAEPYAYHAGGRAIEIEQSGGEYRNGGSIASEPVISIYGSGTFNLEIGGKAYEFDGVPVAEAAGEPAIIVDRPLGDCYSAGGANLNRCLTGALPTLEPGGGTVRWWIPEGATGQVTKVVLETNARDRF